jgi:hypothetical protein
VLKFATPFNLVSKPDRRQNPDRRGAWRGSRRMTDLREFGQLPIGIDAVLEWAPDTDVSDLGDHEVKVAKYVH